MLSFDLRSLESHAALVDGEFAAEDALWAPSDVRPTPSLRVTGRLSRAGSGKYYFSGHVLGAASTTCRRCLRDMDVAIEEDVHFLFADAASDEADEPDVYVIDARARELDLRPALRDEWLLAVPAFPVCSESCLGLCPQCGANRNEGPCSCKTTTDPRWDALSKIRETTS